MDIKDFTNEELIKAVVRFLNSGIYFDFLCEYVDDLESGHWLDNELWKSVEHNERVRSES
jgi:hypothetical protein